MVIRLALAILMLLGGVSLGSPVASAAADTYPRNLDADVMHYRFGLTLSDSTDEIQGEASIDIRFLRSGATSFELDLIGRSSEAPTGMTVTGLWALRAGLSAQGAGGAPLAFRHANDRLHITLDRPSVAGETRRLVVAYHGTPATGLIIGNNKHGDRTFFSDNWPIKARHWLPTLDHPYDKATSEMVVTAPNHYQVISNGLLVEETDLADGTRRTHWRQSVPIATWLYVLGVARFAVEHLEPVRGVPIQTWVYAQDRDAGFFDFAVPTRQVMEFYSDYVGPYAYEKLANVQSNSVGGGMEAATAIFYDDDSVTGDRSVRWRNVVIHEIAHQWFGNAVTEADWNDVWLSEGFATYFTLLFREHAYGRDDFVAGLRDSRNRVLTFNNANPTYRVVHENLDDMSRVTTGQTYQKGGWTLHMLRGLVGDEAFWSGIQRYYQQHMNGNATTDDFRRAMETAAGQDLRWFFSQWLERGGHPELDVTWSWQPDGQRVQLGITQTQADAAARPFRVPLDVELRFAEGPSTRHRITVEQASSEFVLESAREPVEIVIDPNVWLLGTATVTKQGSQEDQSNGRVSSHVEGSDDVGLARRQEGGRRPGA
jgi:aminopeptidase N